MTALSAWSRFSSPWCHVWLKQPLFLNKPLILSLRVHNFPINFMTLFILSLLYSSGYRTFGSPLYPPYETSLYPRINLCFRFKQRKEISVMISQGNGPLNQHIFPILIYVPIYQQNPTWLIFFPPSAVPFLHLCVFFLSKDIVAINNY